MIVNLKVVYAGFWRRLLSLLVDGAFNLLLLIPFFIIFNMHPFIFLGKYGSMEGIFVSVLQVILMWKLGQTPGNIILNIKILNTDFSTISLKTAILRNLGNLISGSCLATIWILNNFYHYKISSVPVTNFVFIWFLSEPISLLFNKEKRALHDFIASTVVVVKGDKPKKSPFSIFAVFLSLVIIAGVPYLKTRISSKIALAEAGDSRAQFDVGNYYYSKQDYTRAAYWMTKSADQGDSYAQNNLGWMYEKGQGVPHNFGKAFDLYMKSVSSGNRVAEQALGALFEKGNGVAINMVEAIKWYRLAAKSGDEQAIKDLKRLNLQN